MSINSIKIPDIGDFKNVEIIELLVKVGDKVNKEDSLLVLETEKAAMEIPAPCSGIVTALLIKLGDKVSEGDIVASIESTDISAVIQEDTKVDITVDTKVAIIESPKSEAPKQQEKPIECMTTVSACAEYMVHAGPATRRLGYELGVDLAIVPGTGKKGRVTVTDVKSFVKNQLTAMQSAGSTGMSVSGAGFIIEPLPEIDFAQFGIIEPMPLSRIKKFTSKSMARNWVTIPHVTQFDEADVTDLENFRKQNKQAATANGINLTPLAFVVKSVVGVLQQYPQFNASLSKDNQSLIYKKYYHIGVAVSTDDGLVVPVIRDVDQKGIYQIAKELSELGILARTGKLSAKQMQGQSFTISSLGNLGGTAFTPIINAPDVAILGVAKLQTKPVFIDNNFVPRMMLPLCLSYDHRVIDGAEAAIFTTKITQMLTDIRNILL